MKRTSQNLTDGNIPLQLFLFMQPIFLAQLCQNLYNSVDSIIVGRFVGTTALAAVTSCGDISHLLVSFFAGLSIGAGVVVSRYFGAEDFEKFQKSIHTTVLFAICFGIGMAVTGIIATPWLLEIVKCPPDVYGEAEVYLRIYFIGVFFTAIYNIASGILRAVGDSKDPLHFLMIACLANIVLDILLVKAFRMGVGGVALATIVSQALSVSLIFRKMLRTEDVYKLRLSELRCDRSILLEVLKSGLPAAIQMCLIAFSNLFVQRYVNMFGSDAMAGVGAAKKIDRYIGDLAKSLGMATAVFASQNIGAKKYSRVFRGVRSAIVTGCVGITLFGGLVYLYAPAVVSVFTEDPSAVQYGVAMMRTILPLYYLLLLQQISSNVLRSFGYSILSMTAQAAGMILCRQGFLLLAMRASYDIRHVYTSYPVGWGASALLTFLAYFILIRWRKRESL